MSRSISPRPRLGLVLGPLVAALLACGGERPVPTLEVVDTPGRPDFGTIRFGPVPEPIRTLSPAVLETILRVYTGDMPALDPGRPRATCTPSDDRPPVLGRVRLDGDSLHFAPRFTLIPGMAYWACIDHDAWRKASGHHDSARAATAPRRAFSLATPAAGTAPTVRRISPESDTVPANLLRLYVQFDQPMQARDIARHVSIVDGAGRVLDAPFVDVPHGLWDRDGTRLTLILDPGRIKRGVGPNRTDGSPLAAGTSIRVRVDGRVRSHQGVALGQAVERRYRVVAADRRAPSPDTWRLTLPTTPAAALVVGFDEVLDRPQAARMLTVVDADDRPVAGTVTISEGDTRWQLVPRDGWRAGDHRLLIDRSLEDLAGNTPDRLFDVSVAPGGAGTGSSHVITPGPPRGEVIALPFSIRFDQPGASDSSS